MINLSRFVAVRNNKGPASRADPLFDLVGRVGVDPTTNGLRESSFSPVIIQINLLQHTPSFKSSCTQLRTDHMEAKPVTKWLRCSIEFCIESSTAAGAFEEPRSGCRYSIGGGHSIEPRRPFAEVIAWSNIRRIPRNWSGPKSGEAATPLGP